MREGKSGQRRRKDGGVGGRSWNASAKRSGLAFVATGGKHPKSAEKHRPQRGLVIGQGFTGKGNLLGREEKKNNGKRDRCLKEGLFLTGRGKAEGEGA